MREFMRPAMPEDTNHDVIGDYADWQTWPG